MEVLKFKKIPGASLAAILHLQLPLKAIGGDGQNGWWDKQIFIESRLIDIIKPLYNKVRHLNVSEKTIDQIQESSFYYMRDSTVYLALKSADRFKLIQNGFFRHMGWEGAFPP